MQFGNRCGARVLDMFHYEAANRGHNGKAPGKVGICRSRPAGRFLQLQFDTLLVEHHIFLFYDHVLVVVGKNQYLNWHRWRTSSKKSVTQLVNCF